MISNGTKTIRYLQLVGTFINYDKSFLMSYYLEFNDKCEYILWDIYTVDIVL